MFATLSSFLPSALQQGSPNPSAKDISSPPAKQEEPQQEVLSTVDEVGVKKKERRTNHESFIVVRPPPAKSNHPLNLQVQLVPPQSRDRDRTRSMDTSTAAQDQDDNALSRTASNRSDVSMYSGYSSVTSFSSVASTSTTSSRRMIIPLYNLQAHNVMTNVIVDAGTDAKVAKFMKRGLEILGLAVLEPVEVFGSNSSLTNQVPPASNRTSIDEHHDPGQLATPRPGDPDGVHTPASSAFSLSSGGTDPAPASAPTFTRNATATPTAGPKKIFGKFFKKKDGPSSPTPTTSPLTSPVSNSFLRTPRPKGGASLTIPVSGNSKRNSWLGPPGPPSATGHYLEPSSSSTTSMPTGSHLQPAVLGIHPLCSSPTFPPQGRPHSYSWVVRKWIKGSNEGLLSNVIGHMNHLNLSVDERRHSRTPAEEGAVELQFIWARGKKKRREGGQPGAPTRRGSAGPGSSKTGSSSSLHRSDTGRATSTAEKRLSTASGHSVSTGSEVGSTAGRGLRGDDGYDEGEESEPEDSETPWTCTLVVRRLGGGGDGAETVRVRVATFSPTPHHPKVVALLKVPFPLPDIVVDRMQVRRRAVSAQGIARPSWNTDAPDGLVLTAEEIKDVVSSTGLWLVVRESIGGVGKVSRKGDGWRIRA